MKNRYDDILRIHNQEIIDLVPYNPILFIEAAKIISGVYTEGHRVLEIGSGEGDSALPILARTDARLELLDVSEEMLEIARERLKSYAARTTFVCEDAYDYLSRGGSYDVIFSAWTVHNFKQEDKIKLFEAIYKNLAPGGIFLLLDKVYPASDKEKLFEHQCARYRAFLSEEVASAIIAHEQEDMNDKYRLDEGPLLDSLKKVGFSNIKIHDRVERDIILAASK